MSVNLLFQGNKKLYSMISMSGAVYLFSPPAWERERERERERESDRQTDRQTESEYNYIYIIWF